MDAVTEPKIHGSGTPETAWRQSPWLAATPLLEVDQLLHGIGRLLVVSPHPDDEVLGCGGVLFRARQWGMEVRIIAVTDGEACYPGDPLWTPPRLREVRPRELATAMRELGVGAQHIQSLGIPDGHVAAHEALLCRRLADIFQAGDRVLVTWRGDGHPDHEATGRAAYRAARLRGASVFEFPVWAWHWMRSDVRHPPLPEVKRYRIDEDAWQAKQRAVQRFVSQLGGAGTGVGAPILPLHVLARFERRYEVFCHARD